MTDFFDRLGCLALRVLSKIFQTLPYGLSLAVGGFFGSVFYYFSNRRYVAYADMKSALGDLIPTERERRQCVREHFHHLGEMFSEVLSFPRLNRDLILEYIEFDNLQRYLDIVSQDRGMVLLTGHCGNWELSQIVSGLHGKPVTVLARDQKHSGLDQILNELRETHGSVAAKRGMGLRVLMKSLKDKEIIGLLGDQDAGRDKGLIMRFFGRKTTVPEGAFELASRTGALVLPCFISRKKGPRHYIDIGEPIDCSDVKAGDTQKLTEKAQLYLDNLEAYIKRHPSQWLWGTKRWKYSWTKRLLILTDGKPGHEKQSQAVAKQFEQIKKQYGREGMEYPTETLRVEFRSNWRKKLFPLFAFLFHPWAQSRLGWLRFFFTDETTRTLVRSSADFVISAGSSLAPLNLLIGKDSKAKSIVLMKPSFPFNFFKYDLVIVPLHDSGIIPEREFRTLLTPNQVREMMPVHGEAIRKQLPKPEKVRVGVFLGGSTRHFQMDHVAIEKLFSVLKRKGPSLGDYIVTTSRRTPEGIAQFLKNTVRNDPSCQMLVIGAEDTRNYIVGGMMDAADILIVTEDSISMISEAISSGKKVIVLNLDSQNLPEKHKRFKEMVETKGGARMVRPENLEAVLDEMKDAPNVDIMQKESAAMTRQLQEIL